MANEYMTVEVKGLSETFRKLDALGSVIQRKAAVDMTRSASGAFARAVRKNCPVRTGTTKKAIRSTRILKRAMHKVYYRVGFTVGRGAKYDGWKARLLEFGTAPHMIPRKGEPGPMVIGRNIFQGPVTHPGHQPLRFVTRSFEETYPKAIATGQRAFFRSLEKYGKK